MRLINQASIENNILIIIDLYPTHSYGVNKPLEKLRRNTKSSNLNVDVPYFLYELGFPEINDIYSNYKPSKINLDGFFKEYTTNNFKHGGQGHAVVIRNKDNYRYDSSGGQNGTIAQKYFDCVLHATNNHFILERIGEKRNSEGKLYYPDFSYKMAENLNMYMTFYFLTLYARVKFNKLKPQNDSYSDYFKFENLGKLIIGEYMYPYQGRYSTFFESIKDPNTNRTIIQEILTEAKINPSGAVDSATGKQVYTESDFIRMLRYVFSYIKDGDLNGTSFSFEKDMPHFLWLFKEVDKGVLGINSKAVISSGNLTEDDINKLIAEYTEEYEKKEDKKKLIILTNKDSGTQNIEFHNFDESKSDLEKASPPNKVVLSYLTSLPSIYYTLFDFDRVRDIERINSSNGLLLVNGFNFSLDYMNQSSNNSLVDGSNKYDYDKTSSSNNYRFGIILHKNIFDIIFSYRYITMDNTNNIIYDDSINFSYFTVGINLGMNYNLFSNNIIPSKFNIMFMNDFSLDKIKQKNNDNSFIYRDINFIINNNNTLRLNNLLLTKIELISSFIYTRRYLSNIKLENNPNYTIENIEHNSYLLNFNINLVKTFKITNSISNNISLGFKYISNLTNHNSNTFKITNIHYKDLYAMVKPTDLYKHLYSLELNYNITVNKRFNLNMNIGKEMNYRNNMFMGVGVIIGM